MSLVHDLVEGHEVSADKRTESLVAQCGVNVYEDLVALRAEGLDSLTINCQPVRWSRVLNSSDSSNVLEKTAYLRSLSREGAGLVELLSGEASLMPKKTGP